MAGTKYDQGKIPLNLLDPVFLYGTAQVLDFGAQKYSAYNWAEGMKWSRVFGALMRHMWAWWGGEENDPETGLCHLFHASCCLMFLANYQKNGVGEDDRYKKKKNNKEPTIEPEQQHQRHNERDIPSFTYTVESGRVSDLSPDLFPSDPYGNGWIFRGYDGQFEYWDRPDGGMVRYDPASCERRAGSAVSRLFRDGGEPFNSLYDLTEGDGGGSLPVAARDGDS
jgi:hypothetical protein